MNSSSVQFFPLRVQLYGLPPTVGALPPPPVPPPMARLQRLSRNLFGAPAAGEVTHLLQEEKKRTCNYMLQRYNFDLQADIAADKIKESSALPVKKEAAAAALPLASLITQELREHERRLQLGTSNLSRRQAQKAETTPPHDTNATNAKRAQLLQIRRIVATASAAVHQHQCSNNENAARDDNTEATATTTESSIPMGSNGSERLKPYARQTLLPNFFSLRKTKQFNGRNALLTVTGSPQHRQLEVLQMPKPMRAASTTSSYSSASATESTLSTTAPAAPAAAATEEEAEQHEEQSTNDNNNDDDDALSLQVSTESSSSLAAATAASTSIHPQAVTATATLSSSATSS